MQIQHSMSSALNPRDEEKTKDRWSAAPHAHWKDLDGEHCSMCEIRECVLLAAGRHWFFVSFFAYTASSGVTAMPLKRDYTMHVHLSFYSCLLLLAEDRLALPTELHWVNSGGITSDVDVEDCDQVILVTAAFIHSSAVLRGTITHPLVSSDGSGLNAQSSMYII